MKRNIFLCISLIILFVFGILMYDFSEELDSLLTGHKWYLDNNDEIYVLSLKNNKFTYIKEDGNKISEYAKCNTYQYNSNVSMLKLKCEGSNKIIYISEYNDKKLVLNNDGEETTFYSSKELAYIENFKEQNNLTDNEYNKLLSINFNNIIDYSKFMSLYKDKKSKYVGFITNNINYKNVYNYQALNKLINNSTKDFYLINIDGLTSKQINKLNKLTKIKDYNNKLYIFEISNKAVKLKQTIDITNKEDLNKYQNI
jgi:hypothetical protein